MDLRSGKLMEFLGYLADTGVSYSLLGNTDKLPGEISSDIDIIISPKKFKNIYGIVSNFCKRYDGRIVQVIEYAYNAWHFVITFEQEHLGYISLQIDFCSSYGIGHKELIGAKVLLENSEFRDGKFWALQTDYEFLYYFLKKIVKASINEEQFDYLRNLLANSSGNINILLRSHFSEATTASILSLFSNNQYKELVQKQKSFRTELWTNTPFSFNHYFLEKRSRLQRIFKPTGLTICFLGRDGSGKSYLSGDIASSLKLVFLSSKKIHLYPGLFFSNKKKEGNTDEPHAQKPRNYILSWLKLLLFLAEYNIGYLLKVFPLKIRSGLIIFDRYYYDIIIDGLRYRQAKMTIPPAAISYLIPSPDLCFIIDATSEVVVKRKGELTPEKAEELRSGYLNFALTYKNCIIIDNSEVSEQPNYLVQKSVLNFLHQRIIARYGD